RVADDPQRWVEHLQGEGQPLPFEESAVVLDRVTHEPGQVQPPLVEAEGAAGNLGHVEQVVHQPGQVDDLTVDDVAGAPGGRRRRVGRAEHVDGVADGGQGVA